MRIFLTLSVFHSSVFFLFPLTICSADLYALPTRLTPSACHAVSALKAQKIAR